MVAGQGYWKGKGRVGGSEYLYAVRMVEELEHSDTRDLFISSHFLFCSDISQPPPTRSVAIHGSFGSTLEISLNNCQLHKVFNYSSPNFAF